MDPLVTQLVTANGDNALADHFGDTNFNSANGISTPGSSFLGAFNGNNAANRRQYEQQKFNATQAQIARNYNTEMSNTAVQRRMRDLKAGGINPILAGKYDASSPSASNATASLGQGAKGIDAVLKDILGIFSSAAKMAK